MAPAPNQGINRMTTQKNMIAPLGKGPKRNILISNAYGSNSIKRNEVIQVHDDDNEPADVSEESHVNENGADDD